MKFNIPLEKVEQLPITTYRLLLFTIFNSIALESGSDGYKLMTPQEEEDELEDQIEYYKNKGFFNG